MFGWARELDVVLYENAVVKNRDMRRAEKFAGGVEARAVENDVIPLPLAGGAYGVDERRILAVEG